MPTIITVKIEYEHPYSGADDPGTRVETDLDYLRQVIDHVEETSKATSIKPKVKISEIMVY